MYKEIERKYLVKILPENYEDYEFFNITQGYVCVDGDGTEVRLREKDKKYLLTIKTGKGLIRDEYEIEITSSEFDKLWPTTTGRRIKKTRYYIPYLNNKINFDIYHGHLKGLFTAEVEFSSVEESNNFEIPEWFGKEVTEDVRYKNKYLAIHGIKL
jgi:adenylate cyclase